MHTHLFAAAKINDAGDLIRGFNITDVQRTGDDANFSVRVTLGGSELIDNLYPVASLIDARAGFTVDLFRATLTGPIMVDVAVEVDHTSGLYLTVFRHVSQ